jgi:hypothetical protein
MKKLMIVIIALMLGFTAFSQKVAVVSGHFGGVYYRPRATFVVGSYVPLYYHPFFYGYPYYEYRYYYRPTKLDLQIADIKNDYEEKIWSARHDKTLTGKERRHEVRELKHERDQAINDAEHNYYKQ